MINYGADPTCVDMNGATAADLTKNKCLKEFLQNSEWMFKNHGFKRAVVEDISGELDCNK